MFKSKCKKDYKPAFEEYVLCNSIYYTDEFASVESS
jgi:hypothetical protein